LITAVLVLLFQVVHLWQGYDYGAPGTDDFIEYWSAGQLFLAGENPYNFDALYQLQVALGSTYESPIIMWNPPWLLVWILPLLLLPFRLAALVWLLLNVALVLLCGSVIWRILASTSVSQRLGIAWIATVAFVPALFTVRMGQMSTLLLVGVVGFLYWMERGNPFLAGISLALTTIKPHVLYLVWIAVVWWIITRRDWRLAAGIGAMMGISLAVLTVFSPAWWTHYRSAIAQPPLYWASPTLGTLLRLLVFRDWPAAQFLPPLVTGLLFAGYLVARKPDLHWRTALPPLLLVSVPTAAYGWTFDQITLLVPYLELVAELLRGEWRARPWHRRSIAAGLLTIGTVMVIENRLGIDEFFFVWVPWALGAVYAYTRLISHAVRADSLALPGYPRCET